MRQIRAAIAEKAFHNQLVKTEFEAFMRSVATLLVTELSSLTNRQSLQELSLFKDILIQDGSSFRVHDERCDLFPRRFGHFGGSAGVELHTTMSLFTDQIARLSISVDTDPERPFLSKSWLCRSRLR